MPTDPLDLLELKMHMIGAVFAFLFGSCLGSLINVLVFRLPRGMAVGLPGSRCTVCHERLTWRENIPILGWILLRGRCRFCKTKISPEYPLVELTVALLFAGLYVLWYMIPPHGTHPPVQHAWFLGIDWATIKPEWAIQGLQSSWPLFVMLVMLVASLVAMTLVDAKTFTIPLQLCWWPTLVGLAAHAGFGAYLSISGGKLVRTAPDWVWAIPSPGRVGWGAVGVAIGGALGLLIANILLAKGLIRRSFADYEAWERSLNPEASPAPGPPDPGLCPIAWFGMPGAPKQSEPPIDQAPRCDPGGMVATPEIGSPEMWVQYPHARREMMKELVFLAPAIGLAVGGAWVAQSLAGPWTPGPTPLSPGTFEHQVPLWLSALSGSLLGYLIGGGVVWGIRILGSLGFGKEAMGLGDVHLMAAVGACVGWIDATLAFFLSAFVALGFWVIRALVWRKGEAQMPYGPYLAIATLLVTVAKPLVEWGLNRIAPAWAPFNLP